MSSYRVFEGLPADWSPDEAARRVMKAASQEEEETQRDIAIVGLMIADLLLHKNRRYGNSATSPVAVFAHDVSPRTRMRVRMDDKISRMMRGLGTRGGDGEHPGVDLAGYLLLDIVADWQGLD